MTANCKIVTVSAGPHDDKAHVDIMLTGVLPSDELTKAMAIRAANTAFGHTTLVSVHDNENGYRFALYRHSARKVKDED